MTNEVPNDQLAFIKQNFPDEFKVGPYLGTYYYGFNMEQPPFKDNLKLRQALSLAIDREILVSKVMRAGELAAYAFIPSGIPRYRSAELTFRNQPMPQRLARARALLKRVMRYAASRP